MPADAAHPEHPSPTATRRSFRLRTAGRLRGFLALAAVIVALDQATKALVRANLAVGETWPEGWELIRIGHVRNTGAAFGILQGAGDFLVIAPLVAIGAITFYLLSLPGHSRWYPVSLSMILGGAIGNLIDRVRLGAVTDFIDPTHYPLFNLADSAIVLGVILMAVLSFLEPSEERAPAPAARIDAEAGAERAG